MNEGMLVFMLKIAMTLQHARQQRWRQRRRRQYRYK